LKAKRIKEGILKSLFLTLVLLCFVGCFSCTKKVLTPKKKLEAQLRIKQKVQNKQTLRRQFPQTTDGVYVFNDQLSSEMSQEQYKFSAQHYVGCQKITRQAARKIRKYNPNFIVLHYRLGIGLGYKSQGEWIKIIEGDNWVREWPDEKRVKDEWFFKWNGQRVFNHEWGYYLMELANASWRNYWTKEVLKQMKLNENDGLFADSFSVPNYFGGEAFTPSLPEIDQDFERGWSKRLESFINYLKKKFGEEFYLIPNVGSWITSRDKTDYQAVDGVMIEGFAAEGEENFYELADWKLQMNRILSLTNRRKILILQSYLEHPANVKMRLFYLASYFLVKGNYTYVNIDMGFEPEYFPEYEVNLGKQQESLPSDIDDFFHEEWGVFLRRYQKGLVLVNPSPSSKKIVLPHLYKLVLPQGGGSVPLHGDVSQWKIRYRLVKKVTLPPHQGMILLKP
jgi:hypothetical protein